ncbi:hypothetical protein Sta7437_4838 (plasmid) [Stanieria cyanosphaera PCC 7437]|uniref:Uncharacterized protein n=1 Tax=Stanieria cyanosphaera (strain ATCC 29371 / PCC 7437) TaxID=111780 RepID=K9Y1I7_STAC7|nr:hypothetical protein [Stanieria cyanosphaera]AFZ38271.1 hypothetical protein Sta7437_4838 [Stanieria cyanosphaera PCC 7437]
MLTPQYLNSFRLLSILLILFTNTPVFALPKPTELLDRNSQVVAQLATSQWQRFNLDSNSSIMMPGYSLTTTDGVEGVHNSVRYFAYSESLGTEVIQKCAVYNCEMVLGLMINEVIEEKNLTLEDSKPIQVNSQQYPANGIEFIARDNASNGRMKGRIYLVGDRLYILGAGTNNDYFDNETSIFLDSLSLI